VYLFNRVRLVTPAAIDDRALKKFARFQLSWQTMTVYLAHLKFDNLR
jgi:hypothetical protein